MAQFQKNMKGTYQVLSFLLFCGIMDAVYKLVQAVDSHGFIQTDRELRYLVDGISIQMQNPLSSDSPSVSFTDLEDESLNTFASPITFDPPALDFGIQPLGMPRMERVYVQNPSLETSVQLLSISGSTLHFHCSFFQEKIIPPGGNTSFDVVFLARQEGNVENTLFIHTSLGSFKYQVLAVGINNPYRLQPFLGVRMPLNSSYAPLIHMHNPHSATLQLMEMYTSGGDLHLELPNGDTESPKELWEIPAYETKIVMRANFVARIERNHTSYIRIKTNSSLQEYLVVPIEVEVSSAPGIYSPTSVLDFGVLRSQDEPKVLSISLFNSGQKHVHVVNVIVAPVNEAVDVKFLPIKIPPDTLHSTEIANITFIPSKVSHQKQCSGKIVIKAKNNQYKLTLPYQVTFLQGSLDFNMNSTRFYTGQDSNLNVTHVRAFNVTNHFNITIVIYSASIPVEAKAHFSLNFSLPHLVKPGGSASLGFIVFNPSVGSDLPLTSYLTLHTNVSHFEIPLICFSGKLQIFLPQSRTQGDLDFGTPSVNEKRSLIFAVINENPVDVPLKHWGSNFSKAYVELVGLDKGNLSTLARRRKFTDLTKGLTLKPHHYAIFRVGVTAPAEEGIYMGEAFIETLYQVIKVPFSLRTAKGSLITDDLFFDNAFPGKISSQPLYIRSTFSHPMTVTSVTPVPEDVRFLFEPSKVSLTLQPENKSMVGKVFFDPRRECKSKCYSGLPTTSQMGNQWLLGMNLPSNIGETDGNLYRNLRDRWQNTVNSGERNMNITFQLDTSEVRGFQLRAHATLQWPRLSSKCHLRFPITQVGNITVKDFALENPSSLPVLVQVVPLSVYPSPQAAVSALSHKLGGESVAFKHTDEIIADVFTLQDLETHNPRSDNPIPAYRKSLEEYFSVQTNKQSIAMLLTPGMRVRVRVGFAPKDDVFRTSLILIRNNLTVLDALVVQGQGGRGQIRIANKDPGSEATLTFELTEKHLKDCENSRSSRFLQPNFTVRRAFTARNTGELPVYVRGFDISGSACEGYGFRVLSCNGFELKPNSSRKIDIAYTPDFTLSKVEQVLSVYTSLGSEVIQYHLVATLPRHMLAKCSQALPRPSWEPLLYYSVVSMSIFLLFCILTAAYFESDRILKSNFYPIVTTSISCEGHSPEKIFDLKAIAKSGDLRHRHTGSQQTKKQESNGNCVPCHNTRNEDNHSEHSSSCSKTKKQRLRSNSDMSCMTDPTDLSKIVESECSVEKSNTRLSLRDMFRKILDLFSFNWSEKTDPEWKSNASTQTNKDNASLNEENKAKDLMIEDSRIISSREKCAAFVSAHESKIKLKGRIHQERSMFGSAKSKKNELSKGYDEETSSTTTESSNTEYDINEKDPHRLPDICMSAQPIKHHRSRVSSRINELEPIKGDMTPLLEGSVLKGKDSPPITEEDDFEISTKNKAHKKIKVDPNKVFGGDILRPSTLELPYKPKPVLLSNRNIVKPETGLKPQSISKGSSSSSSASSTSSTGSRKGSNKPKGIEQHLHELRCSGSPPPLWDNPVPYHNPDETLNQIAQQTANFALRLSPQHSASPKGTRKASLDSGCISYSAVVSGENCKVSGNISPPNTLKEPVVGPARPTNKTQPSKTVKVQRPNCLPINPQKDSNKLPIGVRKEPLGWRVPPQSNRDPLGTSSALNIPIPDEYNQMACDALSGSEPFNFAGLRTDKSSQGHSGVIGGNINRRFSSGDGTSPIPQSWNSQQVSLMRMMQVERRQRLQNYYKQQALQDWPGFDAYEPSLWDPSYLPQAENWSGIGNQLSDDSNQFGVEGGPAASGVENSAVWNSNPVDSLCWSPDSSVWQNFGITDKSSPDLPDPLDLIKGIPPPDEVDENMEESQSETYNAYSSLSSIWSSGRDVINPPSASTWSFSLFSNPATHRRTHDPSQDCDTPDQTKD